MSTSQNLQAITRMFARVVGPFVALIAAAAVVNTPNMPDLVAGIAKDPLWVWVVGPFTLLAGLVVIGLHPYWRGAPAITVSVLGWLSALKGLLIMAVPGAFSSVADGMVGAGTWGRPSIVGWLVILVGVGLYLSYVGWVPVSRRRLSHEAGSAPDRSTAA